MSDSESYPVTHQYTCPECERPVKHLGYDGRCDTCAGLEAELPKLSRAEARHRLHRETAALLGRIGRTATSSYERRLLAERAAFHDEQAEALR